MSSAKFFLSENQVSQLAWKHISDHDSLLTFHYNHSKAQYTQKIKEELKSHIIKTITNHFSWGIKVVKSRLNCNFLSQWDHLWQSFEVRIIPFCRFSVLPHLRGFWHLKRKVCGEITILETHDTVARSNQV